MTQKGYDVLKALIDQDYHSIIDVVVIGKDKNIANDYSAEIEALCSENGLNSLGRTDTNTYKSDYSIAVSWRWLIHDQDSKLIVLHDSLLPRYRGFAPLVNHLINQEPEIGVTALFASRNYDRGPIIGQSASPITYPIKIAEAINTITRNYVELVLLLFAKFQIGEQIQSHPQDESLASYSIWRNEEDYLIDWNQSSEEILTFINALGTPYKGASTYVNGKRRVRVIEAEVFPDIKVENRHVGKVIFVDDDCPVIICGSGLLKLTHVTDDQGNSALPFIHFRIRLLDTPIQQPTNKIERLEWDTRFWNLEIGKVNLHKAFEVDQIAKENFDLIYLFSDKRIPEIEDRIPLMDSKITFEKEIIEPIENKTDLNIQYYRGPLTDELEHLSYESGWRSRFKRDDRLSHRFKDMYKVWITRSLERTYADEVIVCMQGGKIVGFITVFMENSIAVIGLISTDKSIRGKGLGSVLIREAERWAYEKGCTRIKVSTQLENHMACNFYKKLKYNELSVKYIYHYWFSD